MVVKKSTVSKDTVVGIVPPAVEDSLENQVIECSVESIMTNDTLTLESVVIESLVRAKSNFGSVVKDRVNPFHKSKYATLDSINKAVDGPLLQEGFVIIHKVENEENKSFLISKLIHSSGYFNPDWMLSAIEIPKTPDFQKLGSALTYCRRYNKSALLDIVADEDDDGNSCTRITPSQRSIMVGLAKQNGWENAEVLELIRSRGFKSSEDLSLTGYLEICELLKNRSNGVPSLD